MDFDDLDDLDPVDVVDPSTEEREIGIIIYGATGYIGGLMAEHLDFLLSRPGAKPVPWAVAGRNKDKLRMIARRCKTAPGIIQATDPSEISQMIDKCRVLLSAVGPYTACGEDLLRECVNHVTHYVDVASEVLFMQEMVRKYHAKAKEKGVMIVQCAGAVSAPQEILCYKLTKHLGPLKRCTEYMQQHCAASSGVYSARAAALEAMTEDQFSILSDPFSLGGLRGSSAREEDRDGLKPEQDSLYASVWTTPTGDGATSARVLRRSCSLFEEGQASDVRYGTELRVSVREWSVEKGEAFKRFAEAGPPTSCADAAQRAADMRKAGDAPAMGSGPSAVARQGHALALIAAAEGESGASAHGSFFAGSPWEVTAMSAVAGALVLVEELETLKPKERAGVVTPAFAFHDTTWVDRLTEESFAGSEGPKITCAVSDGPLPEVNLTGGCCAWKGEEDGQVPPALPAPSRPSNLTDVKPLPLWYKPKVQKGVTTAQIIQRLAPGEFYGLEFPFTHPMLQDSKFGAPWLTKAFHAAGTLPADNSVSRIVELKILPMSGYDAAGGAAIKALMTVQYEKYHPGLHTKLFVKVPFQESENMMWRMNMSMFGDADGCELSAYQFLTPLLPFRTPKLYFCDIARETTNYILITEQVLFAKEGASVRPYEIFPPIGKYQDYALVDPKEPYFALMRALGRMAAWDKQGRFEGVREIFENTSYARFGGKEKYLSGRLGMATYVKTAPKEELAARDKDMARNALKNVEAMTKTSAPRAATMVNFITNIAPWLFPDDVREQAFLDAFPHQMAVIDIYGWKINEYVNNDCEFEGLVHPNLQADNAYFWRTEDGSWDVGLFDWGGCGYFNYPTVFLGCVTTMLADIYVEQEANLFKCFGDEFRRYGGGDIDVDELLLRTQLMYCQCMMGVLINLQGYALVSTPPEEWATIKDKKDDRIMGRWDTRCHALAAEQQMTVWRRGKHWKVLTEFLDRHGFPHQPPWEIK